MFFKFISDQSTRWFCEVEAKNLKVALEKVENKEVEWDKEPDTFEVYHRIEIAKNRDAYEEGNFEEDEETTF